MPAQSLASNEHNGEVRFARTVIVRFVLLPSRFAPHYRPEAITSERKLGGGGGGSGTATGWHYCFDIRPRVLYRI